tara:strand:+ start:3834 stop:3992 length:159 start_codon:yes stop_codon:yes gene_type:complete
MKVGDLVINVYDKDDGIGIVIGIEEPLCQIYWPQWDTSTMFHEERLKVVNEV